jgi:hypothetical protein
LNRRLLERAELGPAGFPPLTQQRYLGIDNVQFLLPGALNFTHEQVSSNTVGWVSSVPV